MKSFSHTLFGWLTLKLPSVAEVNQGLSRENWQRVTWREGTKGPMTSRFAATRVLPSHSYQHGGDKERTLWLLAE